MIASSAPCDPSDPTVCGWLHGVTGNEWLSRWAVGIGDTALRIALVLLVGIVVRWLAHRTIRRLSESIATGRSSVGRRLPRLPGTLTESSPLIGERRAQRARTIGSVLRSTTTAVVAGIVLLLVLGEFDINLGPLIAGAGILGVALGFGSQTLVKDFLSGILMIVEDQYGVGDVVDLGEASGSVEAVGLRVTRLRDANGTVWYVRNGEILRVGNQSQGWARAVLDVGVSYREDVARVHDLLAQVADELYKDEDWKDLVLEEPEVWGVEAVTADSVVVRLVVKTLPLEQGKVARELRNRIKERFDAENVQLPLAQQSLWLRRDDGPGKVADPVPQRHHAPPPGESKVAADTDTASDSGL